MVKWPNDVWVSGRKLAGILIEAHPPDWAVIGIGMNVATRPGEFPEELRETATSIGGGAVVEDAVGPMRAALDRWIGAPDERVLEEFRRRDALKGREIRWTGAGEGSGRVEGVDSDGNLLVRLPGGELRALGSGEVHLKLD